MVRANFIDLKSFENCIVWFVLWGNKYYFWGTQKLYIVKLSITL